MTPNHPDFSALAPHFNALLPEAVELGAFPAIEGVALLAPVRQFMAASLLHHEEYLRRVLPITHRLRQNPLLRNPVHHDNARALLHPLSFFTSDTVRGTGIPPYIRMMVDLKNQCAKLAEIQCGVDHVPAKVVDGVRQIIQDSGVEAGNITPDYFNRVIRDLQENLRSEISASRGQSSGAAAHEALPSTPAAYGYQWGGHPRLLPEAFQFPDVCVRDCWLLWWTGNRREGIPPYRSLEWQDCSAKKARKRLSDIRVIMKAVEEKAAGREEWDPDRATEESAKAVFLDAFCDLPWAEQDLNKRRINQAWMVPTAVRKLREGMAIHENAARERPEAERGSEPPARRRRIAD